MTPSKSGKFLLIGLNLQEEGSERWITDAGSIPWLLRCDVKSPGRLSIRTKSGIYAGLTLALLQLDNAFDRREL